MMSILSPLIRCGTKTKCFAPNWAEMFNGGPHRGFISWLVGLNARCASPWSCFVFPLHNEFIHLCQ